MAVDITAAALRAACRVGSTTEEQAEVTRLRTYAIERISQYLGAAYATAPVAAVNEACVRLVGYLYDSPNFHTGAGSRALRASGAAEMLNPYRKHGAGVIDADA